MVLWLLTTEIMRDKPTATRRRKRMFYTMMHSKHFYLHLYGIVVKRPQIMRGKPTATRRRRRKCLFNNALNTFYLWLHGRKEGNILFNNALNTFYLRLYGVRHMVMDHSDSEKGNPLPPHGILFPISSKGSCIYIIPQTG